MRVGISGWSYPEWRGQFYPEGLPHRAELRFAAETFATIEINGTFYGLAKPGQFRHWYQDAPRGFRYAVKASRFITHHKKLRNVEGALANFFASGLFDLREKLGPILWQLPEGLHYDHDRVAGFLAQLPRDSDEAAALARRHDDRVREPVLTPDRNRRLRHVLEVRHESYLVAGLVDSLRRHGVALAASHASTWPYREELTAGFVYLRLHGPGEPYASSYSDDALDRWAQRVRAWSAGEEPGDAARITARRPPARQRRDVYVYFDNDVGGYAPAEASALAERLGAVPPGSTATG